MKVGDVVKWNGANRVESGTLHSEQKDGDWIVRLENGKYVVVNEKSML